MEFEPTQVVLGGKLEDHSSKIFSPLEKYDDETATFVTESADGSTCWSSHGESNSSDDEDNEESSFKAMNDLFAGYARNLDEALQGESSDFDDYDEEEEQTFAGGSIAPLSYDAEDDFESDDDCSEFNSDCSDEESLGELSLQADMLKIEQLFARRGNKKQEILCEIIGGPDQLFQPEWSPRSKATTTASNLKKTATRTKTSKTTSSPFGVCMSFLKTFLVPTNVEASTFTGHARDMVC